MQNMQNMPEKKKVGRPKIRSASYKKRRKKEIAREYYLKNKEHLKNKRKEYYRKNKLENLNLST